MVTRKKLTQHSKALNRSQGVEGTFNEKKGKEKRPMAC